MNPFSPPLTHICLRSNSIQCKVLIVISHAKKEKKKSKKPHITCMVMNIPANNIQNKFCAFHEIYVNDTESQSLYQVVVQ